MKKPTTIKEMASLGGYARAAQLTKERLSEIGTKAVKTRWRKAKQENNKQEKRTKWKRKQTSKKS